MKKIFWCILLAALAVPGRAGAAAEGTLFEKLWIKPRVNWIRYTTVFILPVHSENERWGRVARDTFEQAFVRDPARLFQVVDEKREHALVVEINLAAEDSGGRPKARVQAKLTDAWTGEILVLLADAKELPQDFGALAEIWGAELVRLLREARRGKSAGQEQPFEFEP